MGPKGGPECYNLHILALAFLVITLGGPRIRRAAPKGSFKYCYLEEFNIRRLHLATLTDIVKAGAPRDDRNSGTCGPVCGIIQKNAIVWFHALWGFNARTHHIVLLKRRLPCSRRISQTTSVHEPSAL